MKLSLGDNIRRLRRARDLTQEQLADRLGVTYQSVSRWENCTAYPDIELLPAISDVFSVSVDELLGVPETEREKQAQALCDEFCRVMNTSVPEEGKGEWLKSLADIVRKLRVDYAGCDAVWKFWLNCYDWLLREEPILSEVRLFAEARLEKCPGSADVIQAMVLVEDEEKLEAFLKRHATEYDVSRNALLLYRYLQRCEEEKASPLKQQKLYESIDYAISSTRITLYPSHHGDIKRAYATNTAQLGILHAFAEEMPTAEHPITCGGNVDLWAEARIELGIFRARCLSGMGRTEEAFAVLEDVVSLLERVMKITDRIELPTSRFMPDIKWTAEECWFNPNNRPGKLERIIFINSSNNYCYCVCPSKVMLMLNVSDGWAWGDTSGGSSWLDSIKNDSRYRGYIERVERLVQTKDENEPEE